MKTIINKLYYGTLNADDMVLKEDKEYQKLSEKVVEITEKIKYEFGEEEFKSITTLIELTTELNALEVENAFTYGFKYGAIMMVEIFGL